jgi:hypothetical protein
MKCFVIMPFGDPKKDEKLAKKYEVIYSHWIKPTIESIQVNDKEKVLIECHRADKEVRPGDIITHVIENLVTSEIVIADMTGQNPNVFYELGVRHAVSDNTILIAENLDDIPFDLRNMRRILYHYDPGGMLDFQNALKRTIQKILSEPKQIDNPVRKFLYYREMEKLTSSMSETPPGFDVMKSIISEMTHLKKELAEQVGETRQFIKLITTPQENDSETQKSGKIGLEFFEGNWDNMMTGSRYYAKIVNGKLLIPYCYSERTKITGHYYNCRLVEKTLFARFEWFDRAVSGYIFLKIESENRLVGGWWYSEALTSKEVNDISEINDSIPGMNEITLDRDTTLKEMPKWAKEYFEELEQGNKE